MAWRSKGFFYDCMARVTFIVRGPGILPGARTNSLVSTLDMVPLFYQTCQLEPPLGLQGQIIRDLLDDPTVALRHQVFSEMMGRTMVREQGYKYAYYASGEAELYDLQENSNELVNFAPQKIWPA